jgi:hypothetical protein
MSKRPNLAPVHPTAVLDIALRMRAHARLCQQIAIDSADEHVADEFSQLATEFMEVAAQIEGDYSFGVPRERLH